MFRRAALNTPIQKIHQYAALFIAFVMVFAVGTALGFEYIGGFMPCKLCLEERIPYYIGIPLMLITAILAHFKAHALLVRGLFLLLAVMMLYNMGLSIYHTGAEYKFWPGPADCSATATYITQNVGNLLQNINSVHPPSCDTAAGYFLGLSFAGWNVLSTMFLVILNLIAAFIACDYRRDNKNNKS